MNKESIDIGNKVADLLVGIPHEDVEYIIGWILLSMFGCKENKKQMDGDIKRVLALYDAFCAEHRENIAGILLNKGWY